MFRVLPTADGTVDVEDILDCAGMGPRNTLNVVLVLRLHRITVTDRLGILESQVFIRERLKRMHDPAEVPEEFHV